MSRIAKSKLDKTKVKVVFRIQFHATHIPQPGWDKLFVCFIPADAGKVTAKTTKANVRNGSCRWSDPIYETTQLLQDAKTKKYDEKLYKLVVSMGSSRASLGEANINLADYADASKPSSVVLPLQGCDFGSVLHVTIQLLSSKTGFREFEQQRELREKGFQTITNQRVHDEPAGEVPSSAETANDQIVEVNARVRFKSDSPELPSLEEEGELNEDYMDSAVGIDGSSHTSESLYAEKHDISSIHEVDSLRSAISVELGGSSLSQSPRPENGDQCDPRLLAQGSSDWVHGWSSDYSMDNDLATAYEENSSLRGSLEVAESSISELKLEVSSLQSQADVLGTETQRFAQELAADIALGEELSREVSILKSDCTKLKGDIEKLKHSKARQHFDSMETELLSEEVCWTPSEDSEEGVSKNHNGSPSFPSPCSQVPARKKCELEGSSFDSKIGANDIGKDQDCLAHDVQMRLLQGLSLMEDTVREIQNKACQYQGKDLAFLQPDLEFFESVVQGLKGLWQVTPLQNIQLGEKTSVKAVGVMGVNSEQAVWGDGPEGCDVECYHSKGMVNSVGTSLQVLQELDPRKNDLEAADVTNEKISELSSELEQSKAERETLTRKIDEMECYYEAVIQELKECRTQMLDELQSLRHEHSACIYTISDLKSQIDRTHQDINEQLQRSAEDRCNLDDLNRELEKRAIASETTLKRARWNYSIAVGQLQKDLELLSFQVVSLFETNEKLAQQAFTEVSQLGFQECIEEPSDDVQSCLQKDDSESALLKAQHETKLHEVQAETVVSGETKPELPRKLNVLSAEPSEEPKELLNEEILCKEVKRSLHLQEELHQESEQEISEMHELNLHLEVFSKVLQESLHEANVGIRLMKKERDEFAQQLEHSAEVESLMLKLQTALDDVETLRESEAKCITKCNDLALKNNTLEAKLKSISDENCLLTRNVTECEILLDECASYKSKYEACSAEKNGLENVLKQESLEKSHLQREILSLVEELKALKAEFDKQLSVKDSLEKTVAFLRDKLGDLRSRMVSYNEQTNGPTLFSKSLQPESDDENFMTIFLHLEELQQSAYQKILQLNEEKQDLKQKFEPDLRDMATKLDVANAHAEKLQLELQDVEDKLMIRSEVVEKYAEQNRELSSKLSVLETELQHVTSENKDLAQKILTLDCVNKELEKTKLAVMDCMQENKALMLSLQAGNEESFQLEKEISCLKESLRCAHDELQSDRGLRDELEATVRDLTSQLNVKHEQMLSFDDQKAALVHLRQQLSDLELEKSRVRNLLLHSEECQRKVDEDDSSLRLKVMDLETYLETMHAYLLAAEVEVVFTENQFWSRMQELLERLNSSERCNEDLLLKHLDVVTKLNGHMAGEAQCIEENAKLMTALQSLKSELETIVSEKRELADYVDKRSAMWAELENCKTMAVMVEAGASQEKHREIEQLKSMLVISEEEMDNLQSCRDELEITVVVLRSKLDEQAAQLSLLQEYEDELMKLRHEHCVLTYRLSEQILRTEELENLYTHLKEHKDKADADCFQAREKRETEVSAVAMQIAFLREQCETKLQDELLKLQDALDQIENLKRSEASHMKRNEELSVKILELETELQTVLTDKQEEVKAYDRLKAELECCMISLNCCKEEKLRLEASLQECNKERTKVAVEHSTKEQLESSASLANIQEQGNHEHVEPLSEDNFMESEVQQAPIAGCRGIGKDAANIVAADGVNKVDRLTFSDNANMMNSFREAKDASLVSTDEEKDSSQQMKLHSLELGRMKNEYMASLLPEDDEHHSAPGYHGLQGELLQLHTANERLGSIFPLFNEFSGSANALERVLTLEIELAEALQAKKKSSIHFQSSFLKQHNDEEAIFKSFRDINDLIQDMLEVKGRYATVETELKDMQERYSKLSLQFAEVEGERQELVMELKNVRLPRKP